MSPTPESLHEILTLDVGLDPATLTANPNASLAELGLDSMALVELGVLLSSRHGIRKLPDEAGEMSFPELVGHLCR